MIQEILQTFTPGLDPMCGCGGLPLSDAPSPQSVIVFARDTRDLPYLQEIANGLGYTVKWVDPNCM